MSNLQPVAKSIHLNTCLARDANLKRGDIVKKDLSKLTYKIEESAAANAMINTSAYLLNRLSTVNNFSTRTRKEPPREITNVLDSIKEKLIEASIKIAFVVDDKIGSLEALKTLDDSHADGKSQSSFRTDYDDHDLHTLALSAIELEKLEFSRPTQVRSRAR